MTTSGAASAHRVPVDGLFDNELPPEPGIDTTRPNVARVYNYWLGGKDHFRADREHGDLLMQVNPDLPVLAARNRMFLAIAVHMLAADYGIRQFIDLGAGLPAGDGATHEVVQRVSPECRVVYVDNDAVVFSHAAALLARGAGCKAAKADLSDPAAVLADPAVRDLIDLDQPVGVVLGMVLHFFDSATAAAIVAGYRDAVAPGSMLVLSCGSGDQRLADAYQAGALYNHAPAVIASWLGGLELLGPGLADATEWILTADTMPRPEGPGRILAAIATTQLIPVFTPSAALRPGINPSQSRPGPGAASCVEVFSLCPTPRHGDQACQAATSPVSRPARIQGPGPAPASASSRPPRGDRSRSRAILGCAGPGGWAMICG